VNFDLSANLKLKQELVAIATAVVLIFYFLEARVVRYTHTCLIIAVGFCFSYDLILCKTLVNNENQTQGSAVLPKRCNLLKDTGYSRLLLKQEVHLKQHWCL